MATVLFPKSLPLQRCLGLTCPGPYLQNNSSRPLLPSSDVQQSIQDVTSVMSGLVYTLSQAEDGQKIHYSGSGWVWGDCHNGR